MSLTEKEIERYARHIVLADIGGAGQQKLKNAKVLVIGAGGLGAPLLQYLAAAGVGTLGIIDDDVVALSNLQRQIIHDTDHIGMAKTASASISLKRINPEILVVQHQMRLTPDNANELIINYDIVADGSDNFDTRYLVADCCEALKVPLVTAAVGKFDGSITTLMPFDKDETGNLNPRYRDIFPHKPAAGLVPSCQEAGIIGALTGVVGSLQAMEIIKLISKTGELLIGRLLMFDSKNMRFDLIKYKRKDG